VETEAVPPLPKTAAESKAEYNHTLFRGAGRGREPGILGLFLVRDMKVEVIDGNS
jgi:hypothetical protein